MRKKIILIVTGVFMLLTTMFLPMTNGNNTIHAETSVSTWEELSDAVSNAVDGDVIVIEADLVADGPITLNEDKSITIKANGTHTIYRKKSDTYDSLFKVSNGNLILGEGLILSGKVVTCSKKTLDDVTSYWQVPGHAEQEEVIVPNTYTLEDFDETEQVKPKAVFVTGKGELVLNSGNTIGLNDNGDQIVVELKDNKGYIIVPYEGTNYYVEKSSEYMDYITSTTFNASKSLYLTAFGGGHVTSVVENTDYRLYDPQQPSGSGYIGWNEDHERLVPGSMADALTFKATNVVPGETVTYWMIPTATPITDASNITKFTSEDDARNALDYLNNVLAPKKRYWKSPDPTDTNEYPSKEAAQNRTDAYNEDNPDTVNGWEINGVKYVDPDDRAAAEAALAGLPETCNPSNAACSLDGTTSEYTIDKFTGEVGDNYIPKGFFVHVEAGDGVESAKATLNGAILQDFNTSRKKDESPRYVAPVVVTGGKSSFDVLSGGIKNNVVGYIVEDGKAYESADKIKAYIKGGAPNSIRQRGSERRFGLAGIDNNDAGSGITATAGAIIYADGAKGNISGGNIGYNRGDTGGIMATGKDTTVNLLNNTNINHNVGAQFGGGVTTEAGALVAMTGGSIKENVAWFGGGAVFATENGVQWLLGKVDKDARQDGKFVMSGGTIEGNTAFTRGGGFFVDSDGVSLIKGTIKNNMSRMIGGAMYVMGDHPDFTYTVYINKGYIHDNKAVSAGPKNSVATDPDNQKMSQKLVAPECCAIGDELFDGYMDVNSDDLNDGYPPSPHEGSDGTGGGVWLCAYGNTVLNVDDESFIIDSNYATGSSLRGKATQENLVPEGTSSTKAGGNDIHKETKGPGNIVFYGIKDGVEWYDENTGELYTDPKKAVDNAITDFTQRNLTNKNVHKPENYNPDTYSTGDNGGVDVFGNMSRRGGGLAADGTFIFGKAEAMGEAYSELAVTKTWAGGVEPEDVTIRIQLQYEDKDGNENTLNVIELPLSSVVNTNASELDTTFTEGSTTIDGKTVYLGHIVLPITVEDENGEQIPLFDLLSDEAKQIDKIGRNVPEGTKETIPAGYEFKLNEAYGLIALGRYLKAGGTVTLSNAKRKLTFVEVKYGPDGKEMEIEGYELTPSEMKISGSPTFHEEIVYQLQTDGTQKPVGTTITSDVRFEAGLYNDKPSEIDKYVNKAVHKDIELDEEFEYDIIAYVKHGTDKLIIEDKLVEDLGFVSKVSDVKVTYLNDNNHLPKNDIEGKLVNDNADVGKDGTPVANKKVEIKDNKLTVTIENKLVEVKDAKGNVIGYKNAETDQFLKDLWGKWVKVTYKAQIKKDLQDKIKNGQMSLSELSSVTVKADEVFRSKNSIFKDEDRPKPNVGNKPVESTQDHTGIENTASYTLEVKNNPEFRDESNTVTVKPGGDYKKIDVKKVWDDSDNTSKLRPVEIVVNLYRDGALYKEATLNEDNGWKYSFTGLPEDGEYTIEERKVDKYLTVIKGDAEKGFEITNSYREYFPDREFDVDQCGEYVLTKNGSGNISKNTEFTFNVTMIIDKGLSTEKTYKDTLKLKVGESKTYDFVVADTQITVEEVSSDNYDVTYYLDDEKVTETMTIISKGKTSNFEILNSSKEKPPIPKTGIE